MKTKRISGCLPLLHSLGRRSLCAGAALLLSGAVHCNQGHAQNMVDFREAVRSAEPSLLTVTVSATDNIPRENVPRENEAEQKDLAGNPNPNRPRLRWVDPNAFQPNGWKGNQPMLQNGALRSTVASDITSAAFAVEQDVVIAYIGGPAEIVNVQFPDGSVAEGTVLALDYVTGLGAIRVNDGALSGLVVSAAETEPGMPVVSLWLERSSNGGNHLSVDTGMVASRPIANASGLGVTPKIDFGGSNQMAGAPVIDANGIVVGVMVPDNNTKLNCVRAQEVMRLANVATGGKPADLKRGLVGIQFQDTGAMVTEVSPESGAATAGIKAGDIVERVNETSIQSAIDVVSAVASARAGDTLEVSVNRNGESILIPVTLTEHPQQKIAQTQNGPMNFARPGGFAMQRGWKLQDGKMVPMEIDPKMFERDKFPMDEMFQQFNFPDAQAFQFPRQFPRPNRDGFGNPIDGFQVERTDMEKSLQEMQRQLKQLNQKFDGINK